MWHDHMIRILDIKEAGGRTKFEKEGSQYRTSLHKIGRVRNPLSIMYIYSRFLLVWEHLFA